MPDRGRSEQVRGPRRRKPPEDRRREILDAAAAIVLEDGLAALTARRVADRVGVRSGLLTHYFPTIEDLFIACFQQVVASERQALDASRDASASATWRMSQLLKTYLADQRDSMGLLWLDAWRAAADKPRLRTAVVAEMEADAMHVARLVQEGVDAGEFSVTSAFVTATNILALVDAHAAHAAVRLALADSRLNYGEVKAMLFRSAEHELGLPTGALNG